MDKYLSDKRVETAVNRAVKSITDNPADLERELRDFAQTGEDWRQKSMTLEQENEAIRKKLDKVTKELEKVKKAAAFEIGNFNDAEDHKAILKAIVGKGYANDESGRHLLRKHAAAIVEKIQEKAKGDLLGQMQLADHQLRDSAQHRTIINNIDELAEFLEANFKNPTKSILRRKAAVPSTSGTFTTSKLLRSK